MKYHAKLSFILIKDCCLDLNFKLGKSVVGVIEPESYYI